MLFPVLLVSLIRGWLLDREKIIRGRCAPFQASGGLNMNTVINRRDVEKKELMSQISDLGFGKESRNSSLCPIVDTIYIPIPGLRNEKGGLWIELITVRGYHEFKTELEYKNWYVNEGDFTYLLNDTIEPAVMKHIVLEIAKKGHVTEMDLQAMDLSLRLEGYKVFAGEPDDFYTNTIYPSLRKWLVDHFFLLK